MVPANLDDRKFKQALKEALAETLQENRELLHEVFADVLEDFATAEAIREGQKTKKVTRDEVFGILEGKGFRVRTWQSHAMRRRCWGRKRRQRLCARD